MEDAVARLRGVEGGGEGLLVAGVHVRRGGGCERAWGGGDEETTAGEGRGGGDEGGLRRQGGCGVRGAGGVGESAQGIDGGGIVEECTGELQARS